jgi:hypothetical protein
MTKSSTAIPATGPASRTVHVYIGDVDFGPWLLHLQIESRLNEMSQANIVLKQEAAATGPLDYFGLVRVTVETGGSEHGQFAGSIERTFKGTHDGQEFIRLECAGFHKLRDKPAPPFARENLTAPEFIWTVARTAGYSESMLDIEGLDQIEEETVEVAVPMYGVQLDQDFQMGKCLITNASSVEWATSGWSDEKLMAAFQGAPAYVVLRIQAKLLLDAEREAIHAAEVAAGWLAVRLRYGAAMMPNGSIEVFDREGCCHPRNSQR